MRSVLGALVDTRLPVIGNLLVAGQSTGAPLIVQPFGCSIGCRVPACGKPVSALCFCCLFPPVPHAIFGPATAGSRLREPLLRREGSSRIQDNIATAPI